MFNTISQQGNMNYNHNNFTSYQSEHLRKIVLAPNIGEILDVLDHSYIGNKNANGYSCS